MPNRAAPEQAVDESPAANEFAPEASAEETPATSKTLPAPEPVEIAGVPAAVSENSETVAEEKPQIFPVAAEAPAERQRAGAARETLHRASAAARGAIEDNVKRVEKIRHVSTVVLEEASYDASLRFVLVAVALFLLVAVILFVSKVMG